jgi:hypothetical protein
MKKIIFNRLTLFGCAFALIASLLAAIAVTAKRGENNSNEPATKFAVQNDNQRREKITLHKVVAFSNHSTVIPSAGSMLIREDDGVYLDFHATGLTPGHVVTLWLVAFNNPEHCRTNPCSPSDLFNNGLVNGSLLATGGRVVGADGSVSYGAYRAVGDATGAFIGPGIWDVNRAEIHLVTRTHGAASSDPAILAQQLTLFNGGCPPGGCANLQVSIHKP